MVHNDIYDSNKKGGNKLRTYRLITNNIVFEPYLNFRNFEKRKYIAQLRISAHKLKIETGRGLLVESGQGLFNGWCPEKGLTIPSCTHRARGMVCMRP